MRRTLIWALAVGTLLVMPLAAHAQDPTPTPPPAPVAATVTLKLRDVGKAGVLARRGWTVVGTVKPYVEGQTVVVRFHRRGRKIAAHRLAIRPDGANGTFSLDMKTTMAGRITVSASHRATPGMATAVAEPVRVDVLPLHAQPGSRGEVVRVLQRRLAALRYVVGVSGVYDARTARAVLAFRKLTGMVRTDVATEEVFLRLSRGQGAFKVRYPEHGRHVEGDLTHQVLALIDRGRAVRIYPMSSGKQSTPTILGSFRVYMKTPGTNEKGIIYSSYFVRGYAVHGYMDVPVSPASHGCLRVPPDEAISISTWMTIGTPVDTYYR